VIETGSRDFLILNNSHLGRQITVKVAGRSSRGHAWSLQSGAQGPIRPAESDVPVLKVGSISGRTTVSIEASFPNLELDDVVHLSWSGSPFFTGVCGSAETRFGLVEATTSRLRIAVGQLPAGIHYLRTRSAATSWSNVVEISV